MAVQRGHRVLGSAPSRRSGEAMIERYLAGRAAMVTGGASGQGRAIALALAEHGADVAIGSYLATHGPAAAEEDTYLPPRGELDTVCHEIMARGAGAVGCDLDVR